MGEMEPCGTGLNFLLFAVCLIDKTCIVTVPEVPVEAKTIILHLERNRSVESYFCTSFMFFKPLSKLEVRSACVTDRIMRRPYALVCAARCRKHKRLLNLHAYKRYQPAACFKAQQEMRNLEYVWRFS